MTKMLPIFPVLLASFVAAPLRLCAQEIQVNGGNVSLIITTGLPGQEPVPVSNTSITLSYRKQNVLSKITVATVCPGQDFTLKVLATNVTKGVAAPEVTLNNAMLAADFITNIPKTGPPDGSCTLLYTASATFAQGNSTEQGNDVHTITYTIQAQ